MPEPVYQGKPLSAWLEYFDPGKNRSGKQSGEAETAIQRIGTNAIPTMLRMLRTPNLPWKNRLFAWAQKQHVIKIHYVQPEFGYDEAFFGFEVLGPRASNAVPELVKIFDQNPAAQSSIAMIFGQIGPDAKAAVPLLLRGAASTDNGLRNNSLAALCNIQAEPNLVVPVFINALQDPDPQIRGWAISGLQRFRTNAKTAVPALVKLIESKEPPPPTSVTGFSTGGPGTKAAALHALRQIDPEAAAKVSTNVDRDVK